MSSSLNVRNYCSAAMLVHSHPFMLRSSAASPPLMAPLPQCPPLEVPRQRVPPHKILAPHLRFPASE